MMPHLIDINDHAPEGYMRVTLADVVPLVEPEANKLQWSLIYVYGLGLLADGRDLSELAAEVDGATYGIPMTWQEIVAISPHLERAFDIILVGGEKQPQIRVRSDDLVWYENSDMVLQLNDSTLWRIYSRDAAAINRLLNAFNETELKDDVLEGKREKRFR